MSKEGIKKEVMKEEKKRGDIRLSCFLILVKLQVQRGSTILLTTLLHYLTVLNTPRYIKLVSSYAA